MEIQYILTRPGAKAPVYATPGAAAADLCAALDAPLTLAPGQRAIIPTGVAVQLPGPRVGGPALRPQRPCGEAGADPFQWGGRHRFRLPGRDRRRCGEFGEEPVTVEPGERVAQLMILPVAQGTFS